MKKIILSIFASIVLATGAAAQTNNVGIGTSTPGSKLTVNGSFAANYRIETASSVVGDNDFYVAYNGTADGTLTLPAAAATTLGRTYHFKNTSSFVLTVASAAPAQIDNQSGAGVSSVTLGPGFYAIIISKGTTSGTTWEVALLASTTADLTNDAFVNGSSRVHLGTKSDGTARTAGTEFVALDDGKVGVGTSTPGTSIHVKPTTSVEPLTLESLLAYNTTTDVPLYVTTTGVVKKQSLAAIIDRQIVNATGASLSSLALGSGLTDNGFTNPQLNASTGTSAASFDASTGIFTAPNDGDYYFNVKLTAIVTKSGTDAFTQSPNASLFDTNILLNGTYTTNVAETKLLRGVVLGASLVNYANNYSNLNLRLKAGDTVQFRVYVLGGNGCTDTAANFVYSRADSYVKIFKLN